MNPLEGKSQKYLARTEALSDEKGFASPAEAQAVIEGLGKRLVEVPWEPKGKIEFEISTVEGEPARVMVEYDSVIDEKMEKYLRPLRRVSDGPFFIDESRQESVRRLLNVVITQGDRRFSLREVVGDECSVYMRSDAPFKNGFYDPRDPFIIVDDDVASLRGLATLIHETGHRFKDRIEDDPDYNKKLIATRTLSERGTPIFTRERAALVRDERFAAAFSIHMMYRLFGKSEHFDDLKRREYEYKKNYYTEDVHTSVTASNLIPALVERLIHR